jgi:O-antigen ligase
VKAKIQQALLFAVVFLLPTQFGKHFFLPFSFVHGVRIDYLAPTVYAIDIALLFLALFYGEPIKKHLSQHLRVLTLFLLAFATNIIFSPVPQMALYTIARLFEVYIIYVVIADERKKNLPLIISALLSGALLQASLTTWQFINKGSIQGLFYYFGERFFSISTPGIATASLNGTEILRPYGTFSHPNSLGGFYLLIYALALGFLANTKLSSPTRIMTIVLAGISSFLVFFSFSKAAIGAFFLITIVHAILQFAYHRRNNKKICFPCVLSRILIPLILGFLFFQAKGDTYSIDKRLTLIEQTLILFQQAPLFGVGFGNNLYLQAQFPSKYPEFFLQPVHNIFLLLLLQGGLVIFALCSWIALQQSSTKRALLCIAILMTGLVDHYWLTLVQNMLLLGMVFGAQEK